MQPVWRPSQARIDKAALTSFVARFRPDLADQGYAALHKWSIEEPEQFWSAMWDFACIVGDKGSAPYLMDADRFPGAKWFPDAHLNYAENLLRRRDSAVALVGVLEDGSRRELSYADLYRQVAQLAAALIRDGVRCGDRVAGYLPNVPEAVIAMLATASIGAIWSSCSPDFGVRGALDRFGQIEPKVLFFADGYFYNCKAHDCAAKVEALLGELPSVEKAICVSVLGTRQLLSGDPRAAAFDEYLDGDATEVRFEPLPFNHPLFIMFSSGTTGRPKCILHSAGGTLLEHQKEHLLHTDLGPADVFFYFTTCGWMMWNWLISGLACGSRLVLYDGSPMVPAADSLLDLIDKERITVFGTSARYLAGLAKAGLTRPANHGLESLHTLLSTGSPLAPESFQFVYERIKQDLLLASISGGTDIIGAFISGNPTLPVYAGELQCVGLGFDIAIYDSQGKPVHEAKGELVCRAVFPSIPLGFWNDPGDKRFHAAYFERFPGVWTHGDYAATTAHDGVVIFGRSDALLNPGGVRIGTAEIYREVDQIPEVIESVAVGQSWQGDNRVLLFVVLQEGGRLNELISAEIRERIRANATPRHVPAKIIQVADIPRTRSGKLAELAVRAMIESTEVENIEALANPDSLEHFRNLPELQT